MAITAIEYKLLHDLKRRGALPRRPHVVEFGEANWYGDVPIGQLVKDIRALVPDARAREGLEREALALHARDAAGEEGALFGIAKIYYRAFLDPASLTAVDLGGTDKALRLDLNHPLTLPRKFDLALNFGTAEHVFNVHQFFRTVHDWTEDGGLMLHGAPFHGWIDHGFYAIQPTLYFDLAMANGYAVVGVFYCEVTPPKIVALATREQILDMARRGEVGANAMIYAVLSKPVGAAEFRIPMQGYYAGTVSAEAAEAWRALR